MNNYIHYLLNEEGILLASTTSKSSGNRDLNQIMRILANQIEPNATYSSLYMWEAHDPSWVFVNTSPDGLVTFKSLEFVSANWGWQALLHRDEIFGNFTKLPEAVKTFIFLMPKTPPSDRPFIDIPF